MKTECTAGQLEFHGLGRRVVVGQFDGGKISSDIGGLLLREVEQRAHILKRLAVCFTVSAHESTPINSRNNPSILSPAPNTGESHARQSRIRSSGQLLAAAD